MITPLLRLGAVVIFLALAGCSSAGYESGATDAGGMSGSSEYGATDETRFHTHDKFYIPGSPNPVQRGGSN
jgi:hypothetical protein